jgi:hypothetical protein
MTTWDEPSYKTGFHSWLCSRVSNNEEKVLSILEKIPIDIASIDGTSLRDIKELNTHKGYKAIFPRAHMNKNDHMTDELIRVLKSSRAVYTGISAVYKLSALCWEEKVRYTKEIDFKRMFEAQDQFVQYESLLSANTPKRIASIIDRAKLETKYRHYYTRYLSLSSMFHHMSYFARTKSYTYDVEKSRKREEEWPIAKEFDIGPGFSVKLFEQCICIVRETEDSTDGSKDRTCYLLEPNSARRLSQLLRGVAKLSVYFTCTIKQTNSTATYKAFIRYLENMFDSMKRTNRPNELARALDIVLFYYLAKISSDIDDRSIRLQEKKYNDGNYDEIIGLKQMYDIVGGLSFSDSVDVLKVYKILPCPDFDPSTGFRNNADFYQNSWTFGELPKHVNNWGIKISREDFEEYQQLQAIRRYYNLFRKCPGILNQLGATYIQSNPNSNLNNYPYLDPKTLRTSDMKYIEIKGSFEWDSWNMNDPEHFQDKACPPQFINMNKIETAYEYNQMPLHDRSFLNFFLNEKFIPSGDALRFIYSNDMQDHGQRADFKPESKKPDPRNFFSAKPYFRLLRAEFEKNVARYLDHDNSAISGKTRHDSEMLYNRIFKQMPLNQKRLLISFDLEKFSPKMPRETSELANFIWMKAFDRSHMNAVWEHYTKAELHYIHEGIHQTHKPKFIDAEGQLGRCNTAFHIDLMAYAVRQLKKLNLTSSPGILLCLIDDGLLGIDVDKNTSNDTIRKILDVIESVYWYFGLHISWDKTFASYDTGMFLNEIWHKQMRYNGGVKAFLKMQPQKLSDELSVVGKVKGLTAMAHGSIKAGCDPHIAACELFRECFLLMMTFQRLRMLVKQSTIKQLCMFMITPIGLGGIGIPISSSLIGTRGTTPVDEFCDQIAYIMATFPKLANYYEPAIKQKIRVRKEIDQLRSPYSIRRVQKTLTEWKHISYLNDYVHTYGNNKFIQILMKINVDVEAKRLISSLQRRMTYEEVSLAYKMSPLSTLDTFFGKFKRSSSIIATLPRRSKAMLMSRYITELSSTYKETMDLYQNI